jgi:hypothetical protein
MRRISNANVRRNAAANCELHVLVSVDVNGISHEVFPHCRTTASSLVRNFKRLQQGLGTQQLIQTMRAWNPFASRSRSNNGILSAMLN